MKLRDYQTDIAEQGLKKLRELGIIYLSMQTRTGKTITSLEIAEKYGAKSILFVTKKKAIKSIESDAEHFTGLSVTVINYESVHKISGVFDLCIIDEANNLGQFPKPSNRYKELKKLSFNLPCILLSATPSPESFSQLFHQFTINKYHKWNNAKNFYAWSYKYVNKKVKYLYNREVPDYSDAKEDLIKEATDNYFISLTQTEAGIENQVQEKILYCTMSRTTSDYIQLLNKNKVLELIDGSSILGDTAVKCMQKTHQLSSGTVIDETGKGHIVDRNKAIFIRNYFAGNKIAIFYKFKAECELLKQTFTTWTESPEEFQSEQNRIFIGQFQSAREGIRLDKADALIFYNIDFSFLSYEQSKNRMVSKERTTIAPLYFIFNKTGIEPKIYDVVKNKADYTITFYRYDIKQIGKPDTEGSDKGNGTPGMVRSKNNSVQQKRIPGFDLPPKQPRHYD